MPYPDPVAPELQAADRCRDPQQLHRRLQGDLVGRGWFP